MNRERGAGDSLTSLSQRGCQHRIRITSAPPVSKQASNNNNNNNKPISTQVVAPHYSHTSYQDKKPHNGNLRRTTKRLCV